MMNGEQAATWLDALIAAGIGFLRRTLGTEAANLWRDFSLPGVSAGSTEWVSAFIAAQIGNIPEGRSVAAGVVRTIASSARASGGWGYREDVPEDCDSTAWVLLAASATGVDLPRPDVERSIGFILQHQRSDGGFVTFGPTARRLLETPDRAGWFEPEVSVTAAAALALASTGHDHDNDVRRACQYVTGHGTSPLWVSFWWKGFAYATYHAVLALKRTGVACNDERFAAVDRAILQRRTTSGGWANEPGGTDNVFSTSFALRTLLLANQMSSRFELILESLRFLAERLTSTGAFLPDTEMLAPGGVTATNTVLKDGGSVTTACAVRALHEVRQEFKTSQRQKHHNSCRINDLTSDFL